MPAPGTVARPLLRLDTDGTVRLGDVPLDLTPLPRALLALLVENAGQVVTPRQAEHLLRGRRSTSAAAALTYHVVRLRRVLGDDPRKPTYLENVPGLGYRLRREMVAGGG